MQALWAIDRFGVPGVYGRLLGVGEIRRMTRAELIVHASQAQTQNANWAEWHRDNPGLVAMLDDARAAAITEGLVDA